MFGYPPYKEIDPAGLNELRAQGPIDLIDVRSAGEVARGGIAGARHIPLHLIPLKADELDSAKPIVFYCHTGIRSGDASAFMVNKGYSNIYNLRGGIVSWVREGYPVASIDF